MKVFDALDSKMNYFMGKMVYTVCVIIMWMFKGTAKYI